MIESDDPIARARDLAYTASERDARDEIAEYLTQSFALLACEDSARSAVTKVAATVIDKGLDTKALESLNKLATRGHTLLWSGSFDELCHAEGEVPKRIVALFRAARDDAGARPIGPGEREDLAEFLVEMKDED